MNLRLPKRSILKNIMRMASQKLRRDFQKKIGWGYGSLLFWGLLAPVLVLGIATAASAQTATVSVNPSTDSFVTMQNPTLNYGLAGALNVSGADATNNAGQTNGIFASLMRFPLTNALATFNTQLGDNAWTLTGVALQVNENGMPDNALFSRGIGTFEIDAVASDSWIEGTGIPRTPTTDGVAWQDLSSILAAGRMVSLGQFANSGANGMLRFNLALAPALVSPLLAGGDLNLYLQPISDTIGFTFNSHDFGNTQLQPLLTFTASKIATLPTIAVTGVASDRITLSFLTVSNQTYQLQSADSPRANSSNAWTTIASFPPSSTNGTASFADATTNRQKFYRLLVSPPGSL